MADNTSEKVRVPRRIREKNRLREEVIKAAAELFSVQTYEKTSVQQIAERAEVSVGTIYNLFKGKESIFEGLLQMINDNIDSELDETLARISDPIDRVRIVIITYMNYCERYRDHMAILHNENPIKLKGILKKFFKLQIGRVEREFSNSIEEGRLRKEDPHILSLIAFGYVSGLMHELTLGEGNYTVEEFIDFFDRLMLDPLKVGGHPRRVEEEDA